MTDPSELIRESRMEATAVLAGLRGTALIYIAKKMATSIIALADALEAAVEALAEVHEHQCGCAQPGRLDVCVAKPVGAFAVLDVKENG